jgi:carbon-monoxide dehydrogenase large subunit
MGTKNQGQGHETTFKQILHEKLGLDPDEVQFIDGDTDRVAFGMGTNGSRSTVIGGSALTVAADKVIEKGKRIAAHRLEASAPDLDFADGVYSVRGTNKTMTLKAVARAAFVPARLPPGLEGGLYETVLSRRRRTPIPTAATSARSRSIPRPAKWTLSPTPWSMMSAQSSTR